MTYRKVKAIIECSERLIMVILLAFFMFGVYHSWGMYQGELLTWLTQTFENVFWWSVVGSVIMMLWGAEEGKREMMGKIMSFVTASYLAWGYMYVFNFFFPYAMPEENLVGCVGFPLLLFGYMKWLYALKEKFIQG